jgi:glycoprotease/Kae1 family metallohydrolase
VRLVALAPCLTLHLHTHTRSTPLTTPRFPPRTACAAAARRASSSSAALSAAAGAPRRARCAASSALTPAAAPPPRLVLGIETSCDDTGAAVVSSDGRVLGEALASQAALHAPYGGVVPKLAQGAHAAAIDAVVASALASAGVSLEELSAIAVTVGPGLSMCLRVGVVKARALAAQARLPLVPVHHMEAHALIARLPIGTNAAEDAARTVPDYPFVALLVSGGHNMLVLTRGVGDHVILGATLDDAIGEAFDKTARLLGLPVGGGGGPALEALAKGGDAKRFRFSVPLRASATHRGTCEFSYAGLKTAARLRIAAEVGLPREGPDWQQSADDETNGVVPTASTPEEAAQARADIAAAFQAAAVTHLSERTARGLLWARTLAPDAKCLVVAGGVAANASVRAALAAAAASADFTLVAPPPRWCTDNGVMVAWAGCERLALGLILDPPRLEETGRGDDEYVELRPRWPLGPRHPDCEAALSRVRSLRKVRLGAHLGAAAEAPADAEEAQAAGGAAAVVA